MSPSDLFLLDKQGSVSFAQNVYARRDSVTCLELLSILLNIFHKAQRSKLAKTYHWMKNLVRLTWWLCKQVFHN